MVIRFLVQVGFFGLCYLLIMAVSFPFMRIMGPPKLWQQWLEFMMFFPVDNEKIGVFWLPGMIAVIFLNGLIWGMLVISLFRLGSLLKTALI